MRRFVLDSNALDPVVSQSGAYEALRGFIDRGQIELLSTHINIDEIAVIPDSEKRSILLLFFFDLTRLLPTGACVLAVSRLDFARLYDDDEAFEALRSGSIDHSRDALIAATALYEKCGLITNDKRLAKRSGDRGIEVLSTQQLLRECGFEISDAIQ